jgi:hypothetical protein
LRRLALLALLALVSCDAIDGCYWGNSVEYNACVQERLTGVPFEEAKQFLLNDGLSYWPLRDMPAQHRFDRRGYLSPYVMVILVQTDEHNRVVWIGTNNAWHDEKRNINP